MSGCKEVNHFVTLQTNLTTRNHWELIIVRSHNDLSKEETND